MNTKIILFLIICTITVSFVSATDDAVNENTVDTIQNQAMDVIAEDPITDNNPIATDYNTYKQSTDKNIKTDIKQDTAPKTIILNNTNFNEYITDTMFNDKVNSGDTIDIQGYLDGNFPISVNKPLNITSTTNDAYIGHDQRGDSLDSEQYILRFIILNEGSGTNISNIKFNNVHFYTTNFAHDIHINNITMVCNSSVGSGRGMISIREGASNVTINNSYFEAGAVGHSVVVFHYAQNCIFENNTVIGHVSPTGGGSPGNLVYLTTYGGIEDTGETNVTYGNINNTFRYNVINGMNVPANQAICYPFVYEGSNHIVEDNVILRPLRGSLIQVNDYGTNVNNNTFRNNYMPYVERDYITDKNINKYGTLDSDGVFTLSKNSINKYKSCVITAQNISTVINNYGASISALSPNVHTLILNSTNDTYLFERLYAPNTTVIVNNPVTIINSTVKQLILHNSSNVTNNIIINDENQTIISDNPSNDTCIWDNYLISNRNNSIKYGDQTISVLNGTLSNNGPNLNNIHVLTNENYYTLFNEDYTLKNGITGIIMAVDNITNPVIINNEVTLETALNRYTNYSIFANLTYELSEMNISNVVMEDFFGHYTYYHSQYADVKLPNCYQIIDGPIYSYSNITFINGSQKSKVNNIIAKNIQVNTDNINIKNSSLYGKIILNNSNNNNIENNQLFGNNSTINMINSTNNNITDNIIHNKDEYTIILDDKSTNNNIEDNNLETEQTDNQNNTIKKGGIDTINNTQQNHITHNTPYRNVTINIDTADVLLYKYKNNLTVTITYNDQAVCEGQVLCLVNGTQMFKENLTNGSITSTVIPKDTGITDLKIWYISPGDIYNTIGAYKRVNITKFNTSVSLEADSVKIGENISVKATVLDEYNNTINNENITFIINSTEYNIPIIDGIAWLNVTTNESWYNTGVQAKFYPIDSYNYAISNKITLNKGDVYIKIKQSVTDDKMIVTANVTDINGLPVTTGRMRFRGNITSNPYVTDGTATLEIPLTNITEGMTITANFTSNNAFNTKLETITLTLNPTIDSIINIKSINAKVNEQINITAIVTTQDDTPINEGTVTFTTTDYNETVPLINGIATTTHTFTQELTDTITATYTPPDTSEYSPSVNTTTITIKDVKYTLKIDTTTFTTGETHNITARIYYGENIDTKINKGKVTFKVDGKTLKDTNGKVIFIKVINGTATIENYQIPDTWNTQSTIQAIYSGSSELNTLKSDKEEITITKSTPTIILNNTTATQQQTIQINVHITQNQQPVNTGKIIIKINGKTVKDASGKAIFAKVSDGIATLDYQIPESMKAKDYTITAIYLSKDNERIETTATLTVVS